MKTNEEKFFVTVESVLGQESLSVLDLTADRHFHVKHYRIHRTDQGFYYISYKSTFSTLAELVEHYQSRNVEEKKLDAPFPFRSIRWSLLRLDASVPKDSPNLSHRLTLFIGIGTKSVDSNQVVGQRELRRSLSREIRSTGRGDQMYENRREKSFDQRR